MNRPRPIPRILTIMSVSIFLFFIPQSGHCQLIRKLVGKANMGMVTYKVATGMKVPDNPIHLQVQQQLRNRYDIQIYPSLAHVIAWSPWADKLDISKEEWLTYPELEQIIQMPELSEKYKEMSRNVMINTLVASAKCHMYDWLAAYRSDPSADQKRQYALEKARYDMLLEIADNKDHAFTKSEIICLMEQIMAREMVALPIPASVPTSVATTSLTPHLNMTASE